MTLNDIVKEFFNVEIPDSLLPNGSIIVKEGYSDEGGANMNKITVMKKINGFVKCCTCTKCML